MIAKKCLIPIMEVNWRMLKKVVSSSLSKIKRLFSHYESLLEKVNFFVPSFYETIANQEINSFPWKKIWMSRPSKGNILCMDSLIWKDLDHEQPRKGILL